MIIDESFNLLSSKELHYSEARKYIRTALDPYPHNEVSKKGVDVKKEHAINYKPKCPITLFVQPLRFENDILVLEGDIRRFLPVYVFMGDNDKTTALKRRVFDSYNDEDSITDFKNEVSALDHIESFSMGSDVKIRFAELSILLIERGESYSAKINNFMEMFAFTLQNNFLKFSAIQAFQHRRSIIEVEDVELAYVDLFEVMEHCYQYIEYKIPGNLDYGDGWQGARLKDQEALQWLHEMNATSEQDTNASVKDYEDKLKEIFNVGTRQAQKYKNKHESQGWIKSKTGQKNGVGFSKIWLCFDPEEKSTDASGASGAPYEKYHEIIKNIKSYENFTPKGCASDASDAPDGKVHQNDFKPEDNKSADLKNVAANPDNPGALEASEELARAQFQDERETQIAYASMTDDELDKKASFGGDESAYKELQKRKNGTLVRGG